MKKVNKITAAYEIGEKYSHVLRLKKKREKYFNDPSYNDDSLKGLFLYSMEGIMFSNYIESKKELEEKAETYKWLWA